MKVFDRPSMEVEVRFRGMKVASTDSRHSGEVCKCFSNTIKESESSVFVLLGKIGDVIFDVQIGLRANGNFEH